MNNKKWLTVLRISGIVIMIFSFAVVPEEYPWYYEILLFDVGLIMMMIAKSPKFRKQLRSFFALNPKNHLE